MASVEIEAYGRDDPDDVEDSGLTPAQVNALDKLAELGESLPVGDEPYHKNSQIRALQLVAQGRLGAGSNRKGKRRKRPDDGSRLSELLAERMASKADQMERVIDKALKDSNPRVGMEAIKLAIDLEYKERAQNLNEDKFDSELDKMDREELIHAFIAALRHPQVEASTATHLDGYGTEIEDAVVIEGSGTRLSPSDDRGDAAALGDGEAGDHSGVTAVNGRDEAAGSGPSRPNPWTAAARRRSAER